MKVFISWSGEYSHKVALVLRDWLPSVIQTVVPYVSSEDIDKGARWSTDMSKELDESSYGILCLTKDNINATWLNFEAGALSKSFEKSHVSPFLFGIKRSEVKGPTLQFQSTIYEKKDVHKLINSINSACEIGALEETRLDDVFDVWWPKLKEKLDPLLANMPEIEQTSSNGAKEGLDSSSNLIMEEILELVRSQQKILSDPAQLLPPDYLENLVRRQPSFNRKHPALRDLAYQWAELNEFLKMYSEDEVIPTSEVIDKVSNLSRPVRYILSDILFRSQKDLFIDD